MVGLTLLACVASKQGVLRDDGRLQTHKGASYRLVLTPEDQLVKQLTDLTLQVEGRQLGRRIAVTDWRVLAAQDGSAPYLGPLVQRGSNLVIEDRNSGATYVLDGPDDLSSFAGHTVLVVGYVGAAHVITVMGYRVLE